MRSVCSVESVYDASQLRKIFTAARSARCRQRFVAPVILYEGKVVIVLFSFVEQVMVVIIIIIHRQFLTRRNTTEVMAVDTRLSRAVLYVRKYFLDTALLKYGIVCQPQQKTKV